MSGPAAKISSGLQNVSNSAKTAADAATASSRATQSYGANVTGAIASLATGVVAFGAAAAAAWVGSRLAMGAYFAKMSLDAATFAETTKMSLEVVLGSQDAA